MKPIASIALLALVFLSGPGCSCGTPVDNTPDAGPCAQPSPCATDSCPQGCTSNPTCDPATGWQCTCACAVNTANLCAEYARRACDFYVRCHAEPSLFFDVTEDRAPSPPTPSNNQVAESERARCEARIASDRDCFELQESFRAQRATFDATKYSACQAALYPADTCSRDLNVLQELCLKTSFAKGASPVGGACRTDAECAGGWCNASGGGCGTCQPYVPVNGGACTRSAQCDPANSWCSRNAGACVPYRQSTEGCTLTDFNSCAEGLQCVVTFGISGRCTVGLDEGKACSMDRYQCKRSNRALPELLCAPQQGGSGNICQKLQSAAGGPCGNGELIVPDLNDPNGGLRGPLCPESQYCANNVCTPKKPSAAPCAADAECSAGLRCIDTRSGRSCQPFATTGQACGATEDCENLLICAGSTCAPDLALNGEPCPAGVSCAQGFCDASGATPTCAAFKAVGAACAAHGECRSDACSATCQPACWMAP
jgi:hypothetical protein